MTKRDFFQVICKLLGLYLTVELIAFIPQLVLAFSEITDFSYIIIISFLILLLLISSLLFKADTWIKIFRLTKDLETEEINLASFSHDGIVKAGLVILSISMVVSNLDSVLVNLFFAFKESVSTSSLDALISTLNPYQANYTELIYGSFNLVLGFLILTNLNSILRKINAFQK